MSEQILWQCPYSPTHETIALYPWDVVSINTMFTDTLFDFQESEALAVSNGNQTEVKYAKS